MHWPKNHTDANLWGVYVSLNINLAAIFVMIFLIEASGGIFAQIHF